MRSKWLLYMALHLWRIVVYNTGGIFPCEEEWFVVMYDYWTNPDRMLAVGLGERA